MTERGSNLGEPLQIGGVRIETPQLAELLRKTGGELGLAAVKATVIEEAMDRLVAATESAVEHLKAYNQRFGGPPRNASLAHLSGSPLRAASDFKVIVGRYVGQKLAAIGVQVEQLDAGARSIALRALVDRVSGMSLLALVREWQNPPEIPESEESEEAT